MILLLSIDLLMAQNTPMTYLNEEEEKHLCGPFDLSVLTTDTTYANWYQESIDEFEIDLDEADWQEKLQDMKVDIYLGTWCGDSKNWVPKFVKLWDALELDREQLNFIALYDDDDRYKQGPNGEEKGKNIHRVPTFIFYEGEEEVARIVEHPNNDLITDVGQIALGVPSAPSYRAANYLMDCFDEMGVEGVRENFKEVVNKAYRLQSRSSEMNTLGYVYLRAGEMDKATTVFYMNTLCNRWDPNVYDSYAEALEEMGDIKTAAWYYEKAISIDPKSEHAKERLDALAEELEALKKEEEEKNTKE